MLKVDSKLLKEIYDLIKELQKKYGLSLIYTGKYVGLFKYTYK